MSSSGRWRPASRRCSNREVMLPFDLNRTVEIYVRLSLGASYQLSNDLTQTAGKAASLREDGLAGTEGLATWAWKRQDRRNSRGCRQVRQRPRSCQ